MIEKMALLNVCEKVQRMRADLVEEVDEKLSEMVGTVLKEMELCGVSQRHRYVLVDDGNKYKNRVKPSKHGGLPEKQFMARNSLLTDLCEIKHIRTMYNIFIVILIILFINTAVYDLVVVGRLNLGVDLILWNFQGFTTVLFLWLGMSVTTILLFCCFNLWATQRIRWVPNSLTRKFWDYGWLISLVLYQTMFLYVPAVKIMELYIPPASSMALLMEQVRLMMKTYAFVRSNVPRALAYKPHQSGDSQEVTPCPGFSKFLYFLFAPTLIYKDNYPRTKEICWKFVVWCFLEVIGTVFYIAFIFERFLIPMYHDFGLQNRQNTSISELLVVGIFGSIMPATLAFMCAFYCLLHSWMNAFAELLRFADRMFYKDWWTASSHAAYYRLWNIVVHDWLYTYIYKDFSEIVLPGKRLVPTLVVFFVSAVFHEYILALTLRFFYPMLLVAFLGVGVCLLLLTKDIMPCGNILILLTVSAGTGVLSCLYGFEWYARVNCPPVLDPVFDFFLPRSWTCATVYARQH
ncbi:Sterol O-acyltransferase 1 [Cryptotermes secundus]|nr:sterol O-acyltransferase 1 isoform X2 [Cryptotermes secundus]XP_033611008.1 sterol O-acyltransferase 1 isoform X2 [Cryptotermes secundus]PNF16494.1 Sterol O-acyltransferase 1 [Cryptotermes secundus]PNF16495.1 Sterol O-acyltransferase 1 [Cryptotermes secundus]